MTNRSTLPRWPYVVLVGGFLALFILLGLWQCSPADDEFNLHLPICSQEGGGNAQARWQLQKLQFRGDTAIAILVCNSTDGVRGVK